MANSDKDFRMRICTLPAKLVARKLRLGRESAMGETALDQAKIPWFIVMKNVWAIQ